MMCIASGVLGLGGSSASHVPAMRTRATLSVTAMRTRTAAFSRLKVSGPPKLEMRSSIGVLQWGRLYLEATHSYGHGRDVTPPARRAGLGWG